MPKVTIAETTNLDNKVYFKGEAEVSEEVAARLEKTGEEIQTVEPEEAEKPSGRGRRK